MNPRHTVIALGLSLVTALGMVPGANAQNERGNAAPPDARSVSEQPAWAALRAGGIVVFRHANAPGVGDPAGMRLGDCSTQRNLDAEGRAQARRIGARLREQGVAVGQVWSSQWCRTRETAELLGAGAVSEQPAFNSFFSDRSRVPGQTAAARELLLAWRGPGALVVVTHQVNISALTDGATASGEGVVLRRVGNRLEPVGQILP